ncbi:MAG TPA: hypothetical protein DHV02_04385 [Neisseriales bacterium]|nr:hypothetical protein [Neisseriales bacterium]
MKNCNCGSKQNYQNCCGRFIEADELPATAEELMRSRYVAYSQARIEYIQATMRERALLGFDAKEAEEWALSVKWLKLNVLQHYKLSELHAVVEFCAEYRVQNKKQRLHEISEFRHENGRWYYIGMLDAE